MARIEGIVNIQIAGHRRCEVNGKKALFHKWNEQCRVAEPSPMIGGAPGGQISYTVGMVEYEDGTVEEVRPHHIRFLDTGDRLSETDFASTIKESLSSAFQIPCKILFGEESNP